MTAHQLVKAWRREARWIVRRRGSEVAGRYLTRCADQFEAALKNRKRKFGK